MSASTRAGRGAPHEEISWIAFDLGGVLFAEGTGAFVRSFPPTQQAEVEAILRDPLSRALRSGLVAESVYWQRVAPRLPPGWDVARFREGWYRAYTPDPAMFELLRHLAARGADRGYRLAVFSGNVESRVRHLDDMHDFRRLFDREIYSFDHGCTKPDPAFAAALIRTLDTPPNTIAYIDDRPEALAAAELLGVVHGILYRGGEADTVRRRLASLEVLPVED